MNEEQKKRIAHEISNWKNACNCRAVQLTGDRMAALLQELVDAPEALPATNPSQISSSAEPFGYFKAEPFGWTDCAETDDGAIALYTAPPVSDVEPVAYVTGYNNGYPTIAPINSALCMAIGTALYSAPPAPSVPDGWRLVPYTPTVQMLERAGYAVNNRPQPSKYEPSATPAIIFWTAMLNYAPEAPAVQADLRDAELLDWLQNNFYHRQMSDWDARQRSGQNMWVFFAPKNVQSDVREVLRAAIAAEKGGTR